MNKTRFQWLMSAYTAIRDGNAIVESGRLVWLAIEGLDHLYAGDVLLDDDVDAFVEIG